MSQRLADRFAACRQAKRTAFVGFVTAGYPRLQDTVPALLEMLNADKFEVVPLDSLLAMASQKPTFKTHFAEDDARK